MNVKTWNPAAAATLTLLLALLATAFAALPAAAQPPEAAAVETVDPATVTVPRPDLSAMQPAARARVESVQEGLQTLLDQPPASRQEVGQALAFLGQLFHALDLPEAAAQAYSQARRLVPDDPRLLYFLALVHQSRGELETAVREYREFLEEAPQDLPAARLRLGDALLQLGRLEEAEAAYRAVLARSSEEGTAAAFHGLGRVALESGDAQAAVELLGRALAQQPEATAIHYQLAQAYRQLDREQIARYHLAFQGDREVGFPDPLASILGSIASSVAVEVTRDLAAAEDFEETDFLGFVGSQIGPAAAGAAPAVGAMLEQMEAAGAPAVQRGRLHAAHGLLLSRIGDDEASVAAFEAALEGAPELVETRLRLGNALARSGRFADALGHYDQVLTRRPEMVAARVQRASVRANLGQLEEARRDLLAAVEQDPENAEAWLRLAGVQEAVQDADAARQAYERAAELAPRPAIAAEAYTALAGMARREGDATAAAESYARALNADPRHTPAVSGLASLLGQVGRYREAATLYRRLVEEQPDDRFARLGEITALVLGGADRLARERMEAALAHFPGDLNFKDVLARHLAAADDRTVRDGQRAVELALEVYEQVPTPESMETLAMAYAQAGKHPQAVEWQEKVLETVGDQVEPANRARLEANLDLYRAGRACCVEPPRGTEGAPPVQ